MKRAAMKGQSFSQGTTKATEGLIAITPINGYT